MRAFGLTERGKRFADQMSRGRQAFITYTKPITDMNTTKRSLDLSTRPKLRVSEVERQIRLHRVITPVPSRRAILKLCEDGTLETAPRLNGRGAYLIYEDSFVEWVKKMDGSLD